jgi:hypothetical protein
MTLNELVRVSLDIESEMLNNGGEITPELETKMATLYTDLSNKMQSYAFVIESLKQRQSLALEKVKDWNQVINQCERSIETLEKALDISLTNLNKEADHGFEFTIKRQLNPESVEIINEAAIPGEYLITETKTKISKTLIKDALKKSQEVPGAQLTRSSRIVIKPTQKQLRGNS